MGKFKKKYSDSSFSLDALEKSVGIEDQHTPGISKEFQALSASLGIKEDAQLEYISTKKIDIQYCINYSILRMIIACEYDRLYSYTNLINFLKSLLLPFDSKKELNKSFNALRVLRQKELDMIKSSNKESEDKEVYIVRTEWEYQHLRFQILSNFMASIGITFSMAIKQDR